MSSNQRPAYNAQDDPNNLFARVPAAALTFDLEAYMATGKAAPGTNVVQYNTLPAPNHYPRATAVMTPPAPQRTGADRRHSVASGSSQQAGADGASHGNGQSEPSPAWADLKTKAGKERKRLPLACIACRRKKIRCSGEKPACKHCLRSRTPCVYKVTQRKAAPRTDYMAMLDKRLKRMEDRVIKALPKDDLEKLPNVTRAVVKPSTLAQQQKAVKKRSAEEAFGSRLERWAETPEIATPNPEAREARVTAAEAREARQLPPPKQRTKEETGALLTDGLEALPTKDIQLHLAEVYFDYVYGQSYHLLHKPSFMRRLEAGSVPPVLILAVCAVSARFSTHPTLQTEPAFLRGEDWANAALEVAMKRFDSPNIAVLIVFLLLGLHTFGACQGGRSWMLGGMAQRMAYALQLHIDPDHDPLGQAQGQVAELSFTDREIRRRTMWSAFMMDRFNSSGTERPLFASEAGLHLQLPIKEALFQMEVPGPTEQLDGTVPKSIKAVPGQMSDPKANMGVAAYLVRIIWMWGQLVHYKNLGGQQKDKFLPWEAGSRYQELMKQLAQFHKDLPNRLHYNEENLKTHAAENIANQLIYLHVIYQQCVLFSNQFAWPTTARYIVEGIPRANILQGRKLALDSATRISELIREASEYKLVAPFAGYCTYCSSAILIQGAFSKNPQLEASSKENLAHNIIFLSKLKKYWGMVPFMTESLKDLYRQNAEALSRGTNTPTALKPGQKRVFQYGDWYDRYPNGVSQTDYEEPQAAVKKEAGEDAVFSKPPDLQSVEDFFATLSPTSRAKHPKLSGRKGTKRGPHPAGQEPDNLASSSMDLDRSLNTGIDGIAIPNSPYGIPESYSRTPVQARLPPPLPPQPLQVAQAQQHFPQEQQQQTLDPTSLDPFAYAPPLFGNGLNHPGVLSQMDRHLVLQSYNGLDPSATTSHPPAGAVPQQPATDYWGISGDPTEFFMPDVTGGLGNTDGMNIMGMGMGGGGGAWMMPFNLDPSDFSQGLGGNDFGEFGLGDQDPWFGIGGLGMVDPGLAGAVTGDGTDVSGVNGVEQGLPGQGHR